MRVPLILLVLFLPIGYFAQVAIDKEIEGQWLVKLNSNDIGTVYTVLNFETDDKTFNAYTRRGADRDILGLWKSSLARIFTNDFKRGSLIRITDGNISEKGDTIILAAIFRSAIGSYYFNGEVIDGRMNAVLRDGSKQLRGFITGEKNAIIELPLNDYHKIVSEAIDTAKNKIYNRRELESKEWTSFEKTIKKKSNEFLDDVELVFAFYYFASKLPFSHFSLTRIEENTTKISLISESKNLFLEEENPTTALLTIKSFAGTAEEVDSVFSIILEKDYSNLIVDLRNNPGGSVEAGMTFASKVIDSTLIGGYFLTQKWFNENDNLPNEIELSDFSVFSEANYDLIIDGIHKERGLLLKVKPAEESFKGELFIITNERTGSTAEPIVHGLKSAERATIVGETTAGAMLNGERFDLESGFSVFVPTADYYTLDGYRIDQNGVEPHIKLEDKDPIKYILSHLIFKN